MTIAQEKEALNLIESKIKLLQAWLVDHFENPYASRVRKDLSALQVDRSIKERVMENPSKGLPSHGEELEPEYQIQNNPKQ